MKNEKINSIKIMPYWKISKRKNVKELLKNCDDIHYKYCEKLEKSIC